VWSAPASSETTAAAGASAPVEPSPPVAPVTANAPPTTAAAVTAWVVAIAALWAAELSATGTSSPRTSRPTPGTWASQAIGPAISHSFGIDRARSARATSGSKWAPAQAFTSARASAIGIGSL
jgi:hypothetical protein